MDAVVVVVVKYFRNMLITGDQSQGRPLPVKCDTRQCQEYLV